MRVRVDVDRTDVCTSIHMHSYEELYNFRYFFVLALIE